MKISELIKKKLNQLVDTIEKKAGVDTLNAQKIAIAVVMFGIVFIANAVSQLAIPALTQHEQLQYVNAQQIIHNLKLIDQVKVYGTDGTSQTVKLYTQWKDNHATVSALPIAAFNVVEQELLKSNAKVSYLTGMPDIGAAGFLQIALKGVYHVTDALVTPLLFFVGYCLYSAFYAQRFTVLMPDNIDADMDEIIGMEDIKGEVSLLAESYNYRHLFESHGMDHNWNVLFSGPPGVGKTKLASMLAKKLDIPMISLDGSSLETGLVGGGSRTLREIFRMANKMGRCVVFIDEGQALLKRRGASANAKKWEDDTSNTLLSLLDGVKSKNASEIIWIISSNFDSHNADLDPAVLRRFKMKINFRLPNYSERHAMITMFLGKRCDSVKSDAIDIDLLARITAGLSPAHLSMLVDQASFAAIRQNTVIDTNTLLKAFERVTVGMADRAQTADIDKDRELIATHETGHFIAGVARYLKDGLSLQEAKLRSDVIKISVEAISGTGALGFAMTERREVNLFTKQDLEWKVRQLFGGRAAEEIVYGPENVTTGAKADIEYATKILVDMTTSCAMHQGAPVDLSNYRSAEQGRQVLSEEEQAHITLQSTRLYQDMTSIMRQLMPALLDIREHLLRSYSLSKDELFALLEQYWPDQEIELIDISADAAIRYSNTTECREAYPVLAVAPYPAQPEFVHP